MDTWRLQSSLYAPDVITTSAEGNEHGQKRKLYDNWFDILLPKDTSVWTAQQVDRFSRVFANRGK